MPPKRPADVQSVDMSDSDDNNVIAVRRGDRPGKRSRPTPAPSVTPDDRFEDMHVSLREMQHRIAVQDDKFATLETSLDKLVTSVTLLSDRLQPHGIIRETPPRHVAPVPQQTLAGMTPGDATQSLFPWVDEATLKDVVAQKLDVNHLARLVPPEYRQKAPTTAAMGSWLFDPTSGKTTPILDATNNYGKHFPDSPTLVHALLVYSAIRQLYDTEDQRLRIGFTMFIRQLTIWTSPSSRLPWAAVLNYAIAFFRKYQAHPDPQKWVDIDIQLFAEHVSNSTSPAKAAPSKKRAQVCINFNSKKGCTWDKCYRPHVCESCGSKGHPAHECKSDKSK